jgi:magnesium chelatase subunit I
MTRARTVGELRGSGWRRKSVKQELRDNLVARLGDGAPLFPGIVGYEESVLPQVENAILSGQDLVFLGERGQAKTRMARLLVGLLDEAVPALASCEVNDDPFEPICQACRQRLAAEGDAAPIVWLPPERRYGEKLATPDITIADLIGEVDPIKVAEGRYLSDELTIHYGLLPRTNRGIFALNELPDLAERIQVGLLNIMEERDVQIRGYKVRLPLDLYVVASANPEDYTNRGRIITPLKDRFGSQVRTHYPRRLEDEIAIMEGERTLLASDGFETRCPDYMRQVVAELTHLARKSTEISQRSGVSVRVSICNYENLLSSALKRAIRLREPLAVPRVSDLGALVASTAGKIELETLGEAGEDKVLGKLLQRAVLNVFARHFNASELEEVVAAFQGGLTIRAADDMPADEYVKQATQVPALRKATVKLGAADAPATAAAVEFVLEGLHLSRKLNKDVKAGRSAYRGAGGGTGAGGGAGQAGA